MSDLPREPDVFALASDVGLAIAASPDLEEMLSVIARRVAEALDIAVFPHGTDTPEDLVGDADAALYKAKRGGKDRVESYG